MLERHVGVGREVVCGRVEAANDARHAARGRGRERVKVERVFDHTAVDVVAARAVVDVRAVRVRARRSVGAARLREDARVVEDGGDAARDGELAGRWRGHVGGVEVIERGRVGAAHDVVRAVRVGGGGRVVVGRDRVEAAGGCGRVELAPRRRAAITDDRARVVVGARRVGAAEDAARAVVRVEGGVEVESGGDRAAGEDRRARAAVESRRRVKVGAGRVGAAGEEAAA
eukprot:2389468-Prymnesium_polylepis.1